MPRYTTPLQTSQYHVQGLYQTGWETQRHKQLDNNIAHVTLSFSRLSPHCTYMREETTGMLNMLILAYAVKFKPDLVLVV